MARVPEFRTDLFRGTARFYDEFRPAYPQLLLDDLRERAQITGAGRLLDLACGTGQITFGLDSDFLEIWAVDQEPEAIEFARAKALEQRITNIRWIAGRAEDIDLAGYFELVAIGNAFHRLRRSAIAESARRWLRRDGHLALLWCNSPWHGAMEWQRVIADTVDCWTREVGATGRVPTGLSQHLAEEPHASVLTAAGYTHVGDFGFPTPYEWSVDQLIGFMYSTSILSQSVLGPRRGAFERDLRERLLAVDPDGVFCEEIDFSYTLVRNP